jgi:hypothetical protein
VARLPAAACRRVDETPRGRASTSSSSITISATRTRHLAVLEWVYEEIRAQERNLNLEGLPPEQAIRS